ncbi:Magnesium transporter MgtE [Nymphon striatum]|nr:Magnesium transporter MgtE [Nymphon striatum]
MNAVDITDQNEDDRGLPRRLVPAVLRAVVAKNADAVDVLLDPLHPADIADLLEQIDERDRANLLGLWKGGMDGDILSELGDDLREEMIDALGPTELAEAVRDLESDDVVDLVEDLGEDQQEQVLDALDASDRLVVEQALAYPEESAGRLMQMEVVRAPSHWTVGETIDYLRASDNLPEQFYHVILVDPRMKPVGYVTLGRLLGAPRETHLTELMEDSFRTFRVDQDEEDVAYAFNQYHLISAPVVDEDDRLIGVITIDDAMIVLDEEHEEDILRLAGVDGESSLTDKVIATTKRRFPWLAVNLATAIFASLVIAMFEDTIATLVALAVLMPIVASMGGNAGTQSLTVAVRSIATKDLTSANVWRVIRREVLVGLVNGAIFAVVMGLVGWVWFGSPMLGVVIAIAMVVNMVVAGLAGTGIPVLLEKLGIDPALASGAFVTTVTDVVGFFAFLGLAADRKDAARKAAFAARKAAHDLGQGHAGHLSSVLAGYRGVPLAGYAQMRTEIDPTPAMEEAAAHGVVCLPVIEAAGQPLMFRNWSPECDMIDGAFGAKIPATGDWITPEILIVPLVAFSRTGGRLGYGGGFYDRTLEKLRAVRPTLAIGFAYAAQELDDIPLEATDQPLDLIVTEQGIIEPAPF